MITEKLWQDLNDRESEAISGGQTVFLVLLFINNSRSLTSANAVKSETGIPNRTAMTSNSTSGRLPI